MFGAGSIFGGAGGLGGGFPPRQVFEEQYHCYSVAYADKAHLEVRANKCAFFGGKEIANGRRHVVIDDGCLVVCLAFPCDTIDCFQVILR